MNYIEVKNLTKQYPQKVALNNISINFEQGKLHMLLGENGAGKTTLASILSGLIQPTSGDIFINGKKTILQNALDAHLNNIAIVHQTPLLPKNLKVWQTIILGYEPETPYGLIDKTNAINKIKKICNEWNINLPLHSYIYSLSASERFHTALIAALFKKPHFLILDEPTSYLDKIQRKEFYANVIKGFNNGLGIILITHNVREAVLYANTISILKNGNLTKQFYAKKDKISESIILNEIFGKNKIEPAKENEDDFLTSVDSTVQESVLLNFKNVTARPINSTAIFSLNFSVKSKHITTIVGQRESGMETLEELLTGIKKIPFIGNIYFHGKKVSSLSPRILRHKGTGIVSYDRIKRSSSPHISVLELLSIYNTNKSNEYFAKKIISENNINTTLKATVSSLSGGMLQRLILAREMARKPNLLILSEPMQGLDFNSSKNLAIKLRHLADNGTAILVLTSSEYHIASCSDILLYLSGGYLSTNNIQGTS